MLLQDPNIMFVMGFLVGIGCITFMFAAWFSVNKRRALLQLPNFIIFNYLTEEVTYTGRLKRVDHYIPLEFLKTKTGEIYSTWGFGTTTGLTFHEIIHPWYKKYTLQKHQRYQFVILPAFGNEKKMVFGGDNLKFLKAEIIGTGLGSGHLNPFTKEAEKSTKEVVDEWLDLWIEKNNWGSLPEDVEIDYDAVPENFVFVRPLTTLHEIARNITTANEDQISKPESLTSNT